MIRLHLLGFTHDLKGVVFSQRRGSKTGTFWVPIDDAFMTAVGKLEQARRGATPAPRSPTPEVAKDVVGLKDLPERSRALPPVGRSEPRSGLPASATSSRCCARARRSRPSRPRPRPSSRGSSGWPSRCSPSGRASSGSRSARTCSAPGSARPGCSSATPSSATSRSAAARSKASTTRGTRGRRPSGIWRVSVRFSHRGKRRVGRVGVPEGIASDHAAQPSRRRARLVGAGGAAPGAGRGRRRGGRGRRGHDRAAAEGEASSEVETAVEGPSAREGTSGCEAEGQAEAEAALAGVLEVRAGPSRKKPAKRGTRRPAARRRR